MSAPTQYGPPNGQPGYGPPAQQGYGPPAQGQPGPPQYAGPQQYGPPTGQLPAQQGYGPPQGQPGQPPAQQTGVGSPSQQSDDASSFFDGAGGSPSISFPRGEYGVWKGGIFTGVITKKQSKDFDTKKPEFWDSGDPVIDVVVEVLTQDRDANNPLDDGRRRLFVTQKNTHIQDSMASVVKEATRQGFHRGGQLWLCKASQRKGEKSDRNVWQASYTPPTAETLSILDRLPPQGVSQAGADEVAAQASYQQPNGGNPYQAPAGPPPQQYGPPNGYQPAPQQGPPPGYQQAPAGPPPQYQGQLPAQGYGPLAGQQGYQQPQGQPPGYQQAPAGQPEQGSPPPWAGQQPPPQQGAPQQTQNPYYQQ